MGVSYEWDKQDNTILWWHFEGEWQWEEYNRLVPIVRLIVRDRSPERIDSIADFRKTKDIPSGALSHIINVMGNIPENFGIAVILGRGVMFNMLIEILRKTVKRAREQIFTAADEEEARLIIQEARDNQA